MKYLLILSLIVILILGAVWYFNDKEMKLKRLEEKQQYQDTLKMFANIQEKLAARVEDVERAKDAQHKKDSANAERYKNENTLLRQELKRARSPRVVELIEKEPELNRYVTQYENLLSLAELRIDSLEYSNRINAQLCEQAKSLADSAFTMKSREADYLKNMVDAQAETIERLEKKVKKRTWLAALFALLNFAPRP